MADSWQLITPTGKLDLNPSFSAPQLAAGGVSGPGALRRDDRGTYQRSGDGLRTPGPLILTGQVWRDDQNTALIVQELNEIRDAVSNCTSVIRSNDAGTYTYVGLEGGPTPEIIPDGFGGWTVKVDLWPARPEPVFRSAALNNLRAWVAVRPEFISGVLRDIVSRHEFDVLSVTLAPTFQAGALEEPLTRVQFDVGMVVLTPEFTAGNLRDVVRRSGITVPAVRVSPTFASGALESIGVRRVITRKLELTPEFVEGEYTT